MKKFKSIHFQLWAGMMTLVFMVLILLWLFQIVFLENFYTNLHMKGIQDQAKDTIQYLQAGDTESFKQELDALAFENNLSIEWINTDGESIYITGSIGSDGQIPMSKNASRAEAIQNVLDGKAVTLPLTHPRYGNKFMLLGLPLEEKGDTKAQMNQALMINVSLAPVEDTASILKLQLVFITFILLVASLFISYRISKNFTKPILEIKKVSEVMASGNFSSRISTTKKDEIGKLAETINHLGQELSKTEQLRKDLIANVSHELRTPLSLIQGYAETIRDISGNIPDKREKQVGIIIEETQRLSRIVDDILNLSQLQAGYFNLQIVDFPIMETLEAVVSRYSVLSEKTGVRVMLEGTNERIAKADRARIEQVLYNLINNAFNHTPYGGKIWVKMVETSDKIHIEITDTGRGISEEALPYIWERYYKAEESGSKKVGTGLGLAIVRNILEAHQFSYGVESKKEQGTTFWFEIKKG